MPNRKRSLTHKCSRRTSRTLVQLFRQTVHIIVGGKQRICIECRRQELPFLSDLPTNSTIGGFSSRLVQDQKVNLETSRVRTQDAGVIIFDRLYSFLQGSLFCWYYRASGQFMVAFDDSVRPGCLRADVLILTGSRKRAMLFMAPDNTSVVDSKLRQATACSHRPKNSLSDGEIDQTDWWRVMCMDACHLSACSKLELRRYMRRIRLQAQVHHYPKRQLKTLAEYAERSSQVEQS